MNKCFSIKMHIVKEEMYCQSVFWIVLQSEVCGWERRDAEIAGVSLSQTKNFILVMKEVKLQIWLK